jgi:hypothetical protein
MNWRLQRHFAFLARRLANQAALTLSAFFPFSSWFSLHWSWAPAVRCLSGISPDVGRGHFQVLGKGLINDQPTPESRNIAQGPCTTPQHWPPCCLSLLNAASPSKAILEIGYLPENSLTCWGTAAGSPVSSCERVVGVRPEHSLLMFSTHSVSAGWEASWTQWPPRVEPSSWIQGGELWKMEVRSKWNIFLGLLPDDSRSCDLSKKTEVLDHSLQKTKTPSGGQGENLPEAQISTIGDFLSGISIAFLLQWFC